MKSRRDAPATSKATPSVDQPQHSHDDQTQAPPTDNPSYSGAHGLMQFLPAKFTQQLDQARRGKVR